MIDVERVVSHARECMDDVRDETAQIMASVALELIPEHDATRRAILVYAALRILGIPSPVADAAVDYEIKGFPARYPLIVPDDVKVA